MIPPWSEAPLWIGRAWTRTVFSGKVGGLMIRRFPRRSLIVGALWLVGSGCEPIRSWLRQDDDDKKALADGLMMEDDAPRKVIGGADEEADARSFFKNNRRSGGWSSEAREIESHLGAS